MRLGGVKRFMSVFADDSNQQALDEDLAKLIKLVEDETDHTIPDPDAVRVTEDEVEAAKNAVEGEESTGQTSGSAG